MSRKTVRPTYYALQYWIADFQNRKFAVQSVEAKLEHLRREVEEIMAKPDDKSEWADALILLLGAASNQGISTHDLLLAAWEKMRVNEDRTWSGPDAQGVYHHT